jgi:hypothetical protein
MILICLSIRCQTPPARCMAESNGRLHNRRRMGLRKRLRPRAASSNRSGDSSDAKGFAETPPTAMGRATAADSVSREAKKEQQRTDRHRTPCFKGVCQTLLKITTGLVASRPLGRRLRWRRCRVFFSLCHSKSLNGRSGMSRHYLYKIQRITLKSRPAGGFDHTTADNAVILQSQFSRLHFLQKPSGKVDADDIV